METAIVETSGEAIQWEETLPLRLGPNAQHSGLQSSEHFPVDSTLSVYVLEAIRSTGVLGTLGLSQASGPFPPEQSLEGKAGWGSSLNQMDVRGYLPRKQCGFGSDPWIACFVLPSSAPGLGAEG
jgi:hypothetical protein